MFRNMIVRNKQSKMVAKGLPMIISNMTKINGSITSESTIRIEGLVIGEIVAPEVEIGPTGRVEGTISAKTTIVQGAVDGIIECDSLSISGSGTVTGALIYQTIEVETGACLLLRFAGQHKPTNLLAAPDANGVKEGMGKPPSEEPTHDEILRISENAKEAAASTP